MATTFTQGTDHGRKKQNSPLVVKLPAELRAIIYELVLPTSHDLSINHTALKQQRALLQVCHLIREEGSEVFYGKNPFHGTTDDKQLLHFLQTLGSDDGKIIRKITITITFSPEQQSLLNQMDDSVLAMMSGDSTVSEVSSEVAGTIMNIIEKQRSICTRLCDALTESCIPRERMYVQTSQLDDGGEESLIGTWLLESFHQMLENCLDFCYSF